ncbi:hypothetical protein GUJ93_ZPchr0002g24480 [Zizania palustris]|uniref:Uncharacterized protein n=1 Tax=Zizania palustris TaxID=103762 RepID=A0A8J5RS09_ZIZPA|nr:hypothetical protein GUJ93_ZPchr0002g24480 [Zizania palustris]
MDAARASLLLAGGLAVSTAAQSVLNPHLYPYTCRRSQRRFLRPASAVSPSPTPLPVTSAKPHYSRWIVVTEKPHAPAGGDEVSRAESVDYYSITSLPWPGYWGARRRRSLAYTMLRGTGATSFAARSAMKRQGTLRKCPRY